MRNPFPLVLAAACLLLAACTTNAEPTVYGLGTKPSPSLPGSEAAPGSSAPVCAGSSTTPLTPSSKRALPGAALTRTVQKLARAAEPVWWHPLPGTCRRATGDGVYGAPRPLGATGAAIRYRHEGADFGAPTGTPLRAAGGGIVSVYWNNGAAGNVVVLSIGGGQVKIRYHHMSAIFVRTGDWVNPNKVIGQVGESGNAVGAHLHFEVEVAGSGGGVNGDDHVNPVDFMRSVGVEVSC